MRFIYQGKNFRKHGGSQNAYPYLPNSPENLLKYFHQESFSNLHKIHWADASGFWLMNKQLFPHFQAETQHWGWCVFFFGRREMYVSMCLIPVKLKQTTASLNL